MQVTVKVPASMAHMTQNNTAIKCTADTIAECFDSLEKQFAGVKVKLCNSAGQPRRFFAVYVNGEDINYLDGVATTLQDGDEVTIIQAVAGG